jgi:Kef-type K+ transport system membrane component KefB
MTELVRDLALSILMAWLVGVGAHLLRQPLLLAYLIAGFALGPSGLGLVKSQESIGAIAELGLIFMLFMIGLDIDLKKIVRAGKVIIATATTQILGCCVLGVILFWAIGLPFGAAGRWDALYLGLAGSLSSTVIIVKVLYDKRELDTLSGRVTLGVLVLQDLFAILFLAIQPSLNNLQVGVIALSFARVGVLVTVALLVSRFVLPYIFHRIARLPELVLVGALAWCFFVAELAVLLELSREMGALVAGVAIHVSVRARCHRQGHSAARLFYHAILRHTRNTDPVADGRRRRAGVDPRCVYGGKPPADGRPAALRPQAGLAGKCRPGDQPRPDQRILPGPGSSRGARRADQCGNQQRGGVWVRNPGRAQHVCHDEQ